MAEKKIGIIGLGGMGRRHCEAALRVAGARLAAVCDLNSQAVALITQKYDDVAGYTGLQEFLSRTSLDLVVIATYGPSHAPIVLEVARAGIPCIFCEKPMTVSLQAADDMIQVCQAQKLRLAVNYFRRWSSTYHQLRNLLRGGVIGEIRHIVFEMAGGQFASNGGHLWDLIRFLTGQEPVKVLGFLDSANTPNPRGSQFKDPGAYGLAWLSGGAKIFFNMSEDFGVPMFIEIMGSVGRILIDEKAGKWEIWARRAEDRDQPMTRRPSLARVPFEGQAGESEMVECSRRAMEELLGDRPVGCGVHDGKASLLVSVAVHCSHALGGQPVNLPVSQEWHMREFSFT